MTVARDAMEGGEVADSRSSRKALLAEIARLKARVARLEAAPADAEPRGSPLPPLAEVIDAMPAAVALFDSRRRPVACNRRYRELFRGDGEGENVPLPPGAGGESRLADGRRIRTRVRRTASGHLVAVATDVSDHLRTREAVAAHERRLMEEAENAVRGGAYLVDAFQHTPDGLAIFDARDRLVLVNGCYRRMHPAIADLLVPGVSFDELTRAAVARGQFAAPGGGGFVEARIAAHRGPEPVEYQLADGRWIRARDLRIGGEGWLCVRTDITALKRAEEEVRAARAEVEVANRAKSEFLSNMSHELRTPLNAIIGFSTVMADEMFGPLDNVQYREYVNDIRNSSTHLLEIISDILDLAKIETHGFDLHESEVDVARVVRASLRLVLGRAREARLRLTVRLAEGLPALRADERAMKQVLLNLLSNAIKFTPAGGHVTVTVEVEAGGDLLLKVVDTGIGFAESEISRALGAFRQIESAANKTYEGRGLGLPLANALMDLHGGRLEIASRAGAGTTVTARFPAARVCADALPAGPGAQAGQVAPRGGGR